MDLTIEEDLQDFLGVNIEKKKDGTIHLTQPHLIDKILKYLILDNDRVTTKKSGILIGAAVHTFHVPAPRRLLHLPIGHR